MFVFSVILWFSAGSLVALRSGLCTTMSEHPKLLATTMSCLVDVIVTHGPVTVHSLIDVTGRTLGMTRTSRRAQKRRVFQQMLVHSM